MEVEGRQCFTFDLQMASVVWACQSCDERCGSLFDLVSHVRGIHSGEDDLSFDCGVQGCPMTFTRTNTWYKHVIKHHRNEYMSRNACGSSSADSEDSEEECIHANVENDGDCMDDDDDDDDSVHNVNSSSEDETDSSTGACEDTYKLSILPS